MTDDLERLYQEAKAALKAKEYNRAGDLLRQILVVDENYKDASRLLAQSVRLKRRRWHNNPRLWAAVGMMALIGIGILLAPYVQTLYVDDVASPTSLPMTASVQNSAATAAPTAIPMGWKRISIGQEFARDTVTSIAIDPKDSEVLYVGTQHAGIYKSIDGGLSWKPALQGLEAAQITSLAIDPSDASMLYAGTSGGVFKTEDGGENWLRVGPGISLVMDPQNSSHLYARDDSHVYESTDQGKSWDSVYSSQGNCPDAILSLAIHPLNGKTLFAGGGEGCKVGEYISDDGGRTWKLLRDGEIINPGLDALTLGLDQLIVGLDRQGNYSIQAGGAAAFDSTGSVYSYCDAHLCKFNQDEDQNITLGKPDVGVFASINVSPYDPDTIYVGGQGISVSKDGGLTWAKLNNGFGIGTLQLNTGSGDVPILYIQSGECGEVNEGHKVGLDNAGQPLYLSTNGGQSWELSLHTGCYLIQDADALTFYRVGQDWTWSTDATHALSWLWWSKDGGKSWKTAYTVDTLILNTVVAHPFQSGILYAYSSQTFRYPGYGGEKTFISEDYGNNWMTADSTGNDLKPCYGSTLQFIDHYRPMTIDPRDGNHVFVIDNGALLESHDSCETTKTSASAPNASMNSIVFDTSMPGMLYAGTDQGAYISTDDGATWDQVNDGLLGATVVYSITVDHQSNVYAATPYGIFQLEKK